MQYPNVAKSKQILIIRKQPSEKQDYDFSLPGRKTTRKRGGVGIPLKALSKKSKALKKYHVERCGNICLSNEQILRQATNDSFFVKTKLSTS